MDQAAQNPHLAAGDGPGNRLSDRQLTSIVDGAIARTPTPDLPSRGGLREGTPSPVLEVITFRIADLPGDIRGRVVASSVVASSVVQIDVDAAGYGWFVENARLLRADARLDRYEKRATRGC
jgi:hypothetical protein